VPREDNRELAASRERIQHRHGTVEAAKRVSGWLGSWALVVSCLALIASGCATPIGVIRVDPRTAQYELTANALNTDRPSSFSTQQLLNLDLYQLFNDDPKEALARLQKGLTPTGDEERVFSLAELSFLYAENSGDRSYYLAATAYASAFLLPGKNGTPPKPIDPRARWAVDIYNRALARSFTSDDGEHVERNQRIRHQRWRTTGNTIIADRKHSRPPRGRPSNRNAVLRLRLSC